MREDCRIERFQLDKQMSEPTQKNPVGDNVSSARIDCVRIILAGVTLRCDNSLLT